MVRINKYLASLGVASRRKIDDLITHGGVSLNGQTLKELGTLIDPDKDTILVNGKSVKAPEELVYFILNKPARVLSTTKDELGRRTVLSFIKTKERVYPVGRLDEDSTGLILLTNDGELTQKLTHPKFESPKTYEVGVSGQVNESVILKLKTGVFLKEGRAVAEDVRVLNTSPKNSFLEITLKEGKNRQIRRMLGALNIEVLSLKRTSMGNIKLGSLEPGQSRKLTPDEISSLKS